MNLILDLMRELSALNSVSGDEKDVRDYISGKLSNTDCVVNTDPLGNLLVFKKGKNRPKNKIMISAHMDEVGFITTYIDNNGYITLSPVGGISPAVVMGRQVRFKSGIKGVIGGKPIHLLEGDEKTEQPKISKLYADIGAESREESEKYVQLGDPVYFISEYLEFGNGFIKGKALDDRFGCAVMLAMLLKNELPEYDMYYTFTVQEEVGTRGAATAAFNVKPDIALVLETTTACDIAGVSGDKKVCRLGNGPVVTFMDRGTVYDRELYNLAFKIAEKNDIKCQTKTLIAGGNDSSSIHKAVGGIRTVAVSAPCRYLHSPSCVLNKNDCSQILALTEKLIDYLAII